MRFFRNQTFILPGTDSPRPIDYCVSDNTVVFTREHKTFRLLTWSLSLGVAVPTQPSV